ncbi:hypothetical protein [Streptomyces sp. NPDC004976]
MRDAVAVPPGGPGALGWAAVRQPHQNGSTVVVLDPLNGAGPAAVAQCPLARFRRVADT